MSQSNFAYSIVNGNVLVMHPSLKEPLQYTADFGRMDEVKKALEAKDIKKLQALYDVAMSLRKKLQVDQANKAVASDGVTQQKVTFADGVIYFAGEPMHSNITDRIVEIYNAGFSIEPMIKFLENLMQNPSKRAVDELYAFLSREGLPITEDGHFLAHKRVNDQWRDLHTNKIDNSIGKIPEVPRNMVDDDARKACSNGLHVGALSYVSNFGSGGHVVVVKVNPRDVVSVPYEDATKLRCCRYEVLYECADPLNNPVYSQDGQAASVPDDSYWADLDEDSDDDWDDDSEYDDEEDYDDDDLDDDDEDDDEDLGDDLPKDDTNPGCGNPDCKYCN